MKNFYQEGRGMPLLEYISSAKSPAIFKIFKAKRQHMDEEICAEDLEGYTSYLASQIYEYQLRLKYSKDAEGKMYSQKEGASDEVKDLDFVKNVIKYFNNIIPTYNMNMLTIIFLLIFSSNAVFAAVRQDTTSFKIPFTYFLSERIDTGLENKLRQQHSDIDFNKYPVKSYKAKANLIQSLPVESKIDDYVLDMRIRVFNDSLDREFVTLRELSENRIVVLDFWAYWCKPCLASVVHWETNHKSLKDNISVLAVNVEFDFWAIRYAKDRNWKNTQVIGPASYFLANYFLKQTLVGPNVWIKDGYYLGASNPIQESYEFVNQLKDGHINYIPKENRYEPIYTSPFQD